MNRRLGLEAARDHERRVAEGFYDKFLSGDRVLDIGFRGADGGAVPITENAIGIDQDYPGYDGHRLPFPDESQDAVFASHCLEHVQDYREALAEWYRVLKIGGFLIVIVPHRDLYERKRTLPSRFNGDHRRMYTPASLLAEIEHSLPVGGHRIRLMRDVDVGFDYSIPPGTHALGRYEIELVVERIKAPVYQSELLVARELDEYTSFYARKVAKLIAAMKLDNSGTRDAILDIVKSIPVPPFAALRAALFEFPSIRPYPELEADLREALTVILSVCPFDADFYRSQYADLSNHSVNGLREHFIIYGYFEGRKSVAGQAMFDA